MVTNKKKFGDISDYVKTAQAGKSGEKTIFNNEEKDKQTKSENESPREKIPENEDLTEQEIKKPAAQKNRNQKNNESLNHLINKSVKKTVEISMVYDVALEMLKLSRKRRKRLQMTEQPMTTNAIMNEILKDFFSKPEYKKYLDEAIDELSL